MAPAMKRPAAACTEEVASKERKLLPNDSKGPAVAPSTGDHGAAGAVVAPSVGVGGQGSASVPSAATSAGADTPEAKVAKAKVVKEELHAAVDQKQQKQYTLENPMGWPVPKYEQKEVYKKMIADRSTGRMPSLFGPSPDRTLSRLFT